MKTVWCALEVMVLVLAFSAPKARANGKMFAEPVIQAPVEVAQQQAMIQFAKGVEQLVIETAFLGEGTNFAWVVPLPAVPEIGTVAGGFFDGLRRAFQPQLVHRVTRYYLGVAFVCALGLLAWRSYKDETDWVADLPWCFMVAAGAGLAGRSFLIGLVTLGFALYARLFTRSTKDFTVLVLVALVLSVTVTLFIPLKRAMILTMGGEGEDLKQSQVSVVSVQRVGLFDTTTIRSTDPQALMRWLVEQGYHAPESIVPVVRSYVEHGWIFVACKLHRVDQARELTAPHPLLFTFSTPVPIYPMRLTGVDNGECTVDLYVFGERRATARHFRAVRCDRAMPFGTRRGTAGLQIADREAADWIGESAVGTKLTASLSPRQMQSDVEVHWRGFNRKGAYVFSSSGAATVALNVGVPLGILEWMLVGAMRGGWGVDAAFVNRWRWRLVIAAIGVGALIFLFLPKVAVVTGS